MGEVVSILHGRQEGLISDASVGMFSGVDEEKVARAAERVAEMTDKVDGELAAGKSAVSP